MHKLLERQLKRTIGSIDSISKEWKDFIKIVDEVYCQADTDRTLMERSLDLTSEELFKKNQQLQQQVVDLQCTQETLSKQASELELVTQVSTAASTILDTQALLQTVVDLTKDRFGLYHAHIYLLDELGETLVLAAGAGQVGQQMVAEGWNIPFEQEQSLVARAARTRQGVRIDDVCETPDWLPNPLLPDTRSELAVPLIVGERVLGVLDVQSDEVGRFTEDDIRIQTTLAAQVAVALENARLFEEGQRSSFLLNERVKEIDCLNDIGREMEESPPPLPELLQWVTERIPSAMQHPDISVVAIEFDGQVYGAPEAIELSNQIVHGLYIGGELMGRIYIAHTEKRDFIDEESALLGGIATRISGFIENQRLLEQTQQRSVELEKVLAEVRQLAAIVENHPDFIGVGALDGKMLYVNPAGLKMMGLPPDHNVTAMDTNDFHPAVEAEKFVKEGLPTALEKGSWSGEANLLKVDGTTIPVDETIGVNYDTTGTPYSLSITMRDITEQKVAAEALRVSEERFALAVQGTNDGLWDWDIANNTVYWSPRLKEMHGYADDELDVDLDTFSSLLHPDDKEQMKAAIKAHLKDRVPLSLENRARTKSGEYRWHYMRGQAVWDETGRALRLVGSVTDITERKRTEEALRQSEALFAKTFHAGPTPMAISRVSDAMLIDVNQRWEDQWGYRREEVIGRTALDLNLYADPNDPVRLRQLIREHGFVRDYELKVRLESGELRDMLMSLEGVEIYGGARFLATFYDITEQKQAKESLTKRVTELETVAQVSAAALTILDTKELLQTVVDLTKDRFGLYHAHIYLLDEITDTLVLVAGAAEVGPQMVAEGWKIPFEQEQSLVARAARTRQGVIVNDVSKVPDWLPNPLLPDTCSEMAVPLLVGERVLGVLDVQSDELDRFTGDDIRIQTTLAAQVAVALENARLFEEGQRSSFLLNERVKELDCLNDIGREMEESPPPLPELLQWITEHVPPALQYPELSVVAIEFDGQVYGAPEAIELPNQITHGLYIGGELMGRIYIAHTEQHDFIDEESALLGGVATRVSSFIENQRLLEQSQQRSVELEKVLAEVRQLATIVENHPDFLGVGTLNGRVFYINPAGLRMMGLPSDHVITSMEANDFHSAADAERLLKAGIPTAIEKGSWSTDEANLTRTDGTTIPVEETVSINYDIKGEPSTFSITMHDITNRKVAVAEQERLLAEVEAAYRQFVRREWERYLQERHQGRWHIEHQQTGVEIEPDTEGLAKVQDEVFREGKTKIVRGTDDNGDSQLASEDHHTTASVVAPIALRGQVIGTLNLQDIAPNRNWTAEEIALVEAVSEQLALTVENLRLFDDTQRRATREQLTRQITDKMRAAPDADTIIQTGLAELARALGVSRTYVKLSPSLKSDQQEPLFKEGGYPDEKVF